MRPRLVISASRARFLASAASGEVGSSAMGVGKATSLRYSLYTSLRMIPGSQCISKS